MALLGTAAKLLASLELDTKPFESGVRRASTSLNRLDNTSYRVGQRIGKGMQTAAHNIKSIGVAAGGLALTGLVAAVKSASDLNENISKTTVVFGDASKSVLAFSDTTASALGLSKNEALDGAAAFGNMFNTVGLAQKQSAEFSTSLVQLAADMASFNNEDPSEMLLRLRSGLSGEAEPLRRFGVLISAARVQEEAYASGIAKRGTVLTEAQKVQARYNLILKDSVVQQGDFERTSGGLANQMRIAKASIADAGATIGTALLPQVVKLARKFNEFITANKGSIGAFAEKLPALFDQILGAVERLPWAQIGDSFKLMGQGAKAALDLFTSMPSWVQTAVLTGWGLNKLTGGMLGGILKDITGGLIKGVLGINAGVVNVTAGTVNGGGVPSAAGAAGGAAKTGISALGKVFLVGEAIGLVMAVNSVREAVQNGATVQAQGIHQTLTESLAGPNSVQDLQTKLDAINTGIAKLEADPLAVALVTGPALDELKAMRSEVVAELGQLNKPSSASDIKTFGSDHNRPLRIYGKVEDQRGAVKWGQIADNTAKTSTKVAISDDRLEAIKAHTASQIPKLNAITQSVRDRGIAMANKIDATTRAVHAIPPAQQSVKLTVTAIATANSITKSVRQSALYTANHLSAVNKGNNIGWT